MRFFDGRAKFPRFKSKKHKQSIQYPQSVKIVDGNLKFPGKVGKIKTKFDKRQLEGEIKTVTISMTPSGKYFASILTELEGDNPKASHDGKVAGVDLGIKDFAIVNDGKKTVLFANPRHLKKHEKNLARKQAKLSRKQKVSNSRKKARKIVARVHERISNIRQDYLHKLSRKLVNDNQVIIVENYLARSLASCADAGSLVNVKGMVRNHNLAKAISDAGWGIFVNFLSYKLEKEGKVLVEIERWFPSSKTCSDCLYQVSEMPLDIRMWECPNCGAQHDRDENAAKNIRAEGIRMLKSSGTGDSANGGDVRPKLGRKSVLTSDPTELVPQGNARVGNPL